MAAAAALPVPARAQGITTRISVSSSGAQGNGFSTECAISADGRYVAFESLATNLVPLDMNPATEDVFVRDRLTKQTTIVSIDSAGKQGNSWAQGPSISADGRYVAFWSKSALVPGDTNGWGDVFVHDRQTGQTIRASVDSSGNQASGESMNPFLSADGRYVAFTSWTSDLVPGDTNGVEDAFVKDLLTGETVRISVDSSGNQGNDRSGAAGLSADGRYVAFASRATNLVPGDTNGYQDAFVHDRQTGQTVRISVDSSGIQGNRFSRPSGISADGRFVVFSSYASNLVAGDANGERDVFVRDLLAQETHLISANPSGTPGNGFSDSGRLSSDGRYVAFVTAASDLVPGDTNGKWDVLVKDRLSGQLVRVNVDSFGNQSNGHASAKDISADGLCVAFASPAADLVPGDTALENDVFVHDRCCSGEVEVYCTAKTSSAGCVPRIQSNGTPSACAGVGFLIAGQDLLPDVPGLFFYSTAGSAVVPFQGGTLCIQAPTQRLPPLVTVGTPPCGGQLSVDFNTFVASGADPALQPSSSFWGQYWSRDPGDAFGTSLTNAIRGTLCP